MREAADAAPLLQREGKSEKSKGESPLHFANINYQCCIITTPVRDTRAPLHIGYVVLESTNNENNNSDADPLAQTVSRSLGSSMDHDRLTRILVT